ncbi:TIGR04282 family arsenosugar biosynthesis glycosyltransferase [Actinoplanes subtropicus]|uniref:TIGR04282 family arsenosugar biosynthesis glycosyltransferase n=1 Tax=Actinoplanes subtropicus TaxID=543632 RepID=UPI0004C3AA07|nr:TIGR04282 family arsenosugar biosynthesis glycosyltransferase [Actinoplanes subtropicus]
MSRVVVLAKVPVPGRVKTRLCPPCTPEQAAWVACAALADTLDAVRVSVAAERVLVTDVPLAAPPGWRSGVQRGGPLGERIANAFADTRTPGTATLLIGMDTPQLTAGLLDAALRLLSEPGGPDAVLGPAEDGGWWALGLREPEHATVLGDIPTSTSTTGLCTRTALLARGLRVTELPVLRDVDTAPDAHAVAALCPPGRRFPRVVAAEVPAVVAG